MFPRRPLATPYLLRMGLLGAGLVSLLMGSACDRKPKAGQDQAPPSQPSSVKASPSSPEAPALEFEKLDQGSIHTRGVPGGTEGRFIARPAVVASPCGFHLVVSGSQDAWTALVVGHELSWTKEGTPLLLKVDGLTLDVGLIDAKGMGALDRPPAEALLRLAGQWESSWLRREAGAEVPVKNNASGQAHLAPHPAWSVWSAAIGPNKTSADVPADSIVIATVALDERVLVVRALLQGQALALRALRRLVFTVDSIEHHDAPLGRREYVEQLSNAVKDDPTCATIHATHDPHLE